VRLFGRRSDNDEPDSVLLSGYESPEHFRDRRPDWESEAADVSAAVAQALDWIGESERHVEVIDAQGSNGRVIAPVGVAGTEWIEESIGTPRTASLRVVDTGPRIGQCAWMPLTGAALREYLRWCEGDEQVVIEATTLGRGD
jgi:hypothetical protein